MTPQPLFWFFTFSNVNSIYASLSPSPSKYAATFFRFSIIGRCCGQIASHWPQPMQSPALPLFSAVLL